MKHLALILLLTLSACSCLSYGYCPPPFSPRADR